MFGFSHIHLINKNNWLGKLSMGNQFSLGICQRDLCNCDYDCDIVMCLKYMTIPHVGHTCL